MIRSIPSISPWRERLARGRTAGQNRRLAGTATSLCIHALLIIGLLEWRDVSLRPQFGDTPGTAMILMRFADTKVGQGDALVPQPAPVPSAESEPVTAKTPTDLDLSASETTSPEWLVATGATASHPTSAPDTSGGSPTSSYDPYAGAAPLRRYSESNPLPVSAATPPPQVAAPASRLGPANSHSVFELDEKQFDAFRRDARKTLGNLHVTVRLRVRAAPDGVVVEVEVTSGKLDPQAQATLAGLIVGRSMFILSEPSATSAVIDLPPLRLGGWFPFGS